MCKSLSFSYSVTFGGRFFLFLFPSPLRREMRGGGGQDIEEATTTITRIIERLGRRDGDEDDVYFHE